MILLDSCSSIMNDKKVDKIWNFWAHYNISFLIIFVFGAIKTNITHAMIFIMLAWEIIAQKAVKGHFHFLYHTTSEERKWCWIICQVVCQIMPCETPSLFGRIYEMSANYYFARVNVDLSMYHKYKILVFIYSEVLRYFLKSTSKCWRQR